MTRFELAVKVVADEFRKNIEEDYADFGITSWNEMCRAFGFCDAVDAREEIEWILQDYSIKNNARIDLDVDHELEAEDGTSIPYRTLRKAIADELFKK